MKVLFTILLFFIVLLPKEMVAEKDTTTLFTKIYNNGFAEITKHKFLDDNYIGSDTLFIEGSGITSDIFNKKYIIINNQIYDLKQNKYIFNLNELDIADLGFYQNKLYFFKTHCFSKWFTTKTRYNIDTCNCYYYFDFAEKKIKKVASVSLHPYLQNKKFYINTFTFFLVYIKEAVIYLGDKFKAKAFLPDDNIPPFLWLSDTTFLTQVSNGVMVKSDTAKNIDTIVVLPKIPKLLGLANLYRDSTNTVVYEFYKSKPVSNYKFYCRYLIDIENKTFKKYTPIFYEGDFRYELKKNYCYFYQKDKLLFKKSYFIDSEINVKINKNLIAYLEKGELKVYNSKTDKWIFMKESDCVKLVGWLNE